MRYRRRERAYERMVGLDVGEHGASASLLGFKRGGKLTLKASGLVEFEDGADEKAVAAAIRKLWKQGGFRSYTVCAGMHPESLLWKPFSYPDLTDEELEAALHLDAEEDMQLRSDQLIMDKHVYDTGGEEREGFYVAVPRADLDRLTRIMDMAKLFPVIVDISIMAAANLYIRFHEETLEDRAVCLACFDGHHADIVALEDSRLMYARSVAAHSSDMHQVSTYISESIAEVIEHSRIAEDGPQVSSVVFTGFSPEMQETAEACTEITGLPVEIWDPIEEIKLTHHAKKQCPQLASSHGRFTGSLGLALRRAL